MKRTLVSNESHHDHAKRLKYTEDVDVDDNDDDDDSDVKNDQKEPQKRIVTLQVDAIQGNSHTVPRVDYSRPDRIRLLLDHTDPTVLYDVLVRHCGLTKRRAANAKELCRSSLYSLFANSRWDHYLAGQVIAQLTPTELAEYTKQSEIRSDAVRKSAPQRSKTVSEWQLRKNEYKRQIADIATHLHRLPHQQYTLENIEDLRGYDSERPTIYTSVRLSLAPSTIISPNKYPVFQLTWLDKIDSDIQCISPGHFIPTTQYLAPRVMTKQVRGSSWLVQEPDGHWPVNHSYPPIEYGEFTTPNLYRHTKTALDVHLLRVELHRRLEPVLPPVLASIFFSYVDFNDLT